MTTFLSVMAMLHAIKAGVALSQRTKPWTLVSAMELSLAAWAVYLLIGGAA